VPHFGNAVAPLEVGARDVDPREARVALHHRPPGVWAVAIARDEIFVFESSSCSVHFVLLGAVDEVLGRPETFVAAAC